MKRIAMPLAAMTAVLAQQAGHPTGPRMTPPTLASVAPLGAARGTTVEMTLEGMNLAGASGIYFSERGIRGRIVRVKELPDLPDIRLGSNGTPSTIDVGPLPPRNQVTVEVDIPPETPVGPVSFRLLTPLGTSPEGTFLVEPYYGESPDKEPNDTPETAFETYLPSVLAGTIGRAGDVDYFKLRVKAGEEVVFENQGGRIGSTLQPVVRITAADQTVVGEYGSDGGAAATRFSHRFEAAGVYYVRVSDYEGSGRASNFYRILAGKLPVAVSAYPLGLRRGAEREVAVNGFNLSGGTLKVSGEPSEADQTLAVLRPPAEDGESFTELKLDLGEDPEADSTGTNLSPSAAQAVSLPVTVNGRIGAPRNNAPEEHYFRFQAAKGQKVIVEAKARRLGSELDSVVEVLDASGRPVERGVARATWETFTVLRDHDSQSPGIRIQSWNALQVGDYVMIGNEICRVEEVPDGPDEDMRVESFGGVRKAWFGTSPESHGIDRPLYKVQVHPAGARFSPNGLPQVRLYYRNDDGGPGYGKDSWLEFTAPAAGDYLVRIRDVRGLGGAHYSYRLHIREPRPDFRLTFNPRNPNVPRGGTVPVTVTALRLEGFDGPIEVAMSGLPAGVTAVKNRIAPGADTATILVSAVENAAFKEAAPIAVTGRAEIGGRIREHRANPEDRTALLALGPAPDILVAAETQIVELEPGQTAEVKVRVKRQNGFAGRVPVLVRDLPSRVRVTDSGLNGVLITEEESERSFKLWALPNASPVEGLIHVMGNVETRSPQQNLYAAAQPVLVRVKPPKTVAAR